MPARHWIASFALVVLCSSVVMAQADEPAPSPATAPATPTKPLGVPSTVPTTQHAISPEARAVIDAVGKTYDGLRTLELTGNVSTDLDVQGHQVKKNESFTASFLAPNAFRHEYNGDITIGSTGAKTYAYQKSHNVYISNDAPKAPVAVRELPAPIPQILMMQNPSLALAISNDATHELTENTNVSKLPDTKIGDKSYQTIEITSGSSGDAGRMTYLIDPASHLVRQVRFDLKESLEKRGAVDVKAAMITVDYTAATPNAAHKPEEFAWTPPAGAKDAKTAKPEQQQGDNENAAQALVGKPAPDFKLPGLDGKDVSSTDLKGSVVILDFWATWCGPCVQSLPHLNKVYEANKQAGLKVFAINLQEDKDEVEKFVKDHSLTIPVLLESDGKTASAYLVNPIPQTVLVGKDGKVRNVFIGVGPTTAEDLEKAVAEALAEK